MTKLIEVKTATMEVTYFLNSPMSNLLFYCFIILYWEKVTSYEKFRLTLTFQRFNAIDGSIKILKNSWISPTSHQITSYCVFGTNTFLQTYVEISKHLFSICFNNTVLGVKNWCSANVFSDTEQKHICWKICKVRKAFDCVVGAYYFQCQVNWVCKMSDLFR